MEAAVLLAESLKVAFGDAIFDHQAIRM